MKNLDASLRFYLIADSSFPNFLSITKSVLPFGITCLQLRMKNEKDSEVLRTAETLYPLCERYQIPLLINDRLSVAKTLGASGVHIGQNDASVFSARELLGPDAIIGLSAHNKKEAIKGYEKGADYLGCGALYPTSTKKDANIVSLEELEKICKLPLPVVGIGGLDAHNISGVLSTGVRGVCFSSAIYLAPHPIQIVQSIALTLQKTLKNI